MVHFWRVLETWLQPLVCFALLSPPGQCYTDDRAAQKQELKLNSISEVPVAEEGNIVSSCFLPCIPWAIPTGKRPQSLSCSAQIILRNSAFSPSREYLNFKRRR